MATSHIVALENIFSCYFFALYVINKQLLWASTWPKEAAIATFFVTVQGLKNIDLEYCIKGAIHLTQVGTRCSIDTHES